MMPAMIKFLIPITKKLYILIISLTWVLLFVDRFQPQLSNILAKVHPWFLGSTYSVIHT
jgi:hypothetical protein